MRAYEDGWWRSRNMRRAAYAPVTPAAGSGASESQAIRQRASDSHLDLSRAPYVFYGVKYIDLVSLAPFSGAGCMCGRFHHVWV